MLVFIGSTISARLIIIYTIKLAYAIPNGIIDIFLKTYFLHWLEALRVMRNMSRGVAMIRKLENLLAQT